MSKKNRQSQAPAAPTTEEQVVETPPTDEQLNEAIDETTEDGADVEANETDLAKHKGPFSSVEEAKADGNRATNEKYKLFEVPNDKFALETRYSWARTNDSAIANVARHDGYTCTTVSETGGVRKPAATVENADSILSRLPDEEIRKLFAKYQGLQSPPQAGKEPTAAK